METAFSFWTIVSTCISYFIQYEFMFVQTDCCMDQHVCYLHSYLKIGVTKWRHDLRYGAKMFSGAVEDYEGFWGATSIPIRCLCC